jgi:two-component system response regulator (stage 0 sporulation protein F)
LILVIDDSETERKMVRKVLEGEGYTVREAADGFEGVKLYSEVKPLAVICDLKMPGKDGWETMREIRAIDPDAKLIAISGFLFGYADYAIRVQGLGIAAVVEKPFGAAYLRRVVGEVLSGDKA